MANFSGSYGFMPIYAMMAMVAALPATIMLWFGAARSAKLEDGSLDYQLLKRRLNRILFPLCTVLYLLLIIPLASGVQGYGNILAQGPAILLAAALPTIGMYGALLFSATILNKNKKLFSGRWLLWTLALMVALMFIGIQVVMVLSTAGSMIEMTSYY